MDDLKLIKKFYGEAMMHFCRSNFSTILENKGQLFSILKNHFEPSKYLYDDICLDEQEDAFIDYINSFYTRKKSKLVTTKSTSELLSEKDYTLYECKTLEDLQKFKKYYTKSELLCTFDDKKRLNKCYVFFAVRKDADKIKREDFKNPKREDLYGTSVISIQFTKGDINTLSIKNRYNHTVFNPDATFSNNLDNINEGLTKAFEKDYNLNILDNNDYLGLSFYIQDINEKWYKYNYDLNNIFYGPNNTILNNKILDQKYKKEKERYIVIDYFILDLKEKKVKLYDDTTIDSFIDGLSGFNKIDVFKDKKNDKKIITLFKDEGKAIITLNKYNNIIEYENDFISEIGDFFLMDNNTLEILSLKNVKKIGSYFLYNNGVLKKVNLPKTNKIDDFFLSYDDNLEKIYIPNLEEIGDSFLCNSNKLVDISFPKLRSLKNNFADENYDDYSEVSKYIKSLFK